ncbi:MAG TPA: pyrroline-5-carboxylate reductase [Candidatus Thermoplasmatota archaeon]|nr:pyrroline-5-carboxylate reductase [Candidatus Thermoplasmatota archaeon]
MRVFLVRESQVSRTTFDGRVAILGCGAMGAALANGLLDAGLVRADAVAVANRTPARAEQFARLTGARFAEDWADAARGASVVVVAVKPAGVAGVLAALEGRLAGGAVVISVAAGVRLETLEAALGGETPVVRAMPNAPASVGEAATCLARGARATDAHVALARGLFAPLGYVLEVDESQMDAVTGLAGSGPAFVAAFVEALADGGVKAGLARDQARALALQTLLGTARLLVERGGHPAELKDRVASPAGTTMAGLHMLEKGGFRATVMDAVEAAAKRSAELGARKG